MGRTATINIKNETGYNLSFGGLQMIHGDMEEHFPPKEIGIGQTGSFKVANTSSSVGPKGILNYKATVMTKAGETDLNLVFFWDHPFGASTSTYTMTSYPPGFSRYSLSPDFPEGENPTLTITAWLVNTENAYAVRNWMKYVDGSRSMADLTIPGTHDSGAVNAGPAFQTQTRSIPEQLDMGLRFLDIRLKIKDDILKVYHGDSDQHLLFTDVMDACMTFLDKYPSESIIVSIKNEDGGQNISPDVYNAIMAKGDYWYTGTEIPTLDEVRKKMLLFRRFPSTEKFGLDTSPWQDNNPSFWVGGGIHVQDRYEVYDTLDSIDNKWDEVVAALDLAKNGPPNCMYVNFLSGATGIDPLMLATGRGIVVGAVGMNEHMYQYMPSQPPGRYGIMLMDFPESPGEFFVPYIINTNFQI